MALDRPRRGKAHGRLFGIGLADFFDVADRRAAMPDRVAISDLLIFVRRGKQPRPRAAEDGLHVSFMLRALAGGQ